MEIVKIRTSADNIKKDGKKRILEEGKKWDSVYNEIEKECKDSENHLREQEEIVTKEEERQQKEREEKEAQKLQARIDTLLKYPMVYTGTGYTYLSLAIENVSLHILDDEAFNAFVTLLDKDYTTETARIAEEQRKAKEESDRLEAENKRLQKIAGDQAAEAERLQKEKDTLAQAKNKARQDRLFAIGLTWNGREYAYRALVVSPKIVTDSSDDVFDESLGRCSAEVKRLKDEYEADLAAEQKRISDLAAETERKRIAKEKADEEQAERDKQAEIERKKALAPDKDKLIEYADYLAGIELPFVKSPEAQNILDTANDTIQDTISFIRNEANKL
jgi:Skp family chaperone for outer membrane proteins